MGCGTFSFDSIAPIPLNDSILKGSGWCKEGYIYENGDVQIVERENIFSLYPFYQWMYYGVCGMVYYVHELQNLLRAIGCFDLAKNFKVEL